MANKKRELTANEVARLGDEIYERVIRQGVEQEHHGRIVAIDVNSEQYEIGDNVLDAARALLARIPDAEIWLVRIGHRALHRIGYHHVIRSK